MSQPIPFPPPGTVHLWTVDLRWAGPVGGKLALALPGPELARANRFRYEQHRRRFVVRRTALRSILGGYLGLSGEEVEYQPGTWGKLELLGPEPGLSFNLSHSEDCALIAVGAGGRLGVDVEQIRALPDHVAVAEHFFSHREIEALGSLEPEERLLGFFVCWTKKEALVKATGAGLQIPLDSFDVSVVPEQGPALLHLRKDEGASPGWNLWQPIAPTGFVAALASDRPIQDVGYGTWSITDDGTWVAEAPS